MLPLLLAAALSAADPVPLDEQRTPRGAPTTPVEQVVLVCSGSAIVTHSSMNQDLTWNDAYTGTSFDHQVVIDFVARTVQLNGRNMVVSRMDDERVVFSSIKPGLLTMALDTPIYTIERRTGAYRFKDGSGTCQRRAPTERLF
jgi:hypothetical protein